MSLLFGKIHKFYLQYFQFLTSLLPILGAIQAALNAAKQPVLVIAAAEQDQAKENLEGTEVAASAASEEPAREDPTEQIVAAVMEVMAESEPAKEASSVPAAEPQEEVAPAEPETVVPEPAKESANPEPAPQAVAEPEPAQEATALAEPAKETAETEPAKKAAEPQEMAEPEPAKETAEPEPAQEVAEPEPAKETAEPETTNKAAEPEPSKEVAASDPAQEQSAPAEQASPAAVETQPAEPAKELAENAPSVMVESMEVEIIPKLETAASIPIYHISPIVNADDLEKQRLAIELAGENYIYFAGYNDEERIR